MPIALGRRGDTSPFRGLQPLVVVLPTRIVVFGAVAVAVFLSLVGRSLVGEVSDGGVGGVEAAVMPRLRMRSMQATAEGEMNHRGEGRKQADNGTHLRVAHYEMVSVRRSGRSRILVVSAAVASRAIMAKASSVAEGAWAFVAGGAKAADAAT